MTPSRLPAGGSSPASRSTPTERIADAGLALRRAIDGNVHASDALAADAAELSTAYRADGTSALGDARAAEAYAAVRMPATFAAAARAMAAAADRLPGFSPASLLDLGAGPGRPPGRPTAVWPTIERSSPSSGNGRPSTSAGAGGGSRLDVAALATPRRRRLDAADVVAAGYLLGELDPELRATARRPGLGGTARVLVLVEPGSRAGFERILAARDRLIAAGARSWRRARANRLPLAASGPRGATSWPGSTAARSTGRRSGRRGPGRTSRSRTSSPRVPRWSPIRGRASCSAGRVIGRVSSSCASVSTAGSRPSSAAVATVRRTGTPATSNGATRWLRRPRPGLSHPPGGRSAPTFRGMSATPDALRPIPCPV